MIEYRVKEGSNIYSAYKCKEDALKACEENPSFIFQECRGWTYRGYRGDGSNGEIWIGGNDFINAVRNEVPSIIKETFGASLGYKLNEASLLRIGPRVVLLKVKYHRLKKLDDFSKEEEMGNLLFYGVDPDEFGDSYKFELK